MALEYLCCILSWAFIFLSQQRITQPSSRDEIDLLVKSSMQSLKHLSTSFEYICKLSQAADIVSLAWEADAHEILHLPLLHAALQLLLL